MGSYETLFKKWELSSIHTHVYSDKVTDDRGEKKAKKMPRDKILGIFLCLY